METRRLVLVAVCICFALTLASPVSATADVTVTVDGEVVDDGETVELGSSTAVVNVSVESDGTLSLVHTEAGSSSSFASLDRANFTTSRTVTVTSETVFTVEATDGDGTTTHEVTLRRSTGSASDAQRTVNDLQDRVNDIEDEVNNLEDRRQELQDRRDNLSEQLNETEGSDRNSNNTDGGSEGLPGFGVLVALVSFAVVGIARGL
jgi:chromosome segregation ATPase